MSRWIRLNTDVFISEWLYPLSAGARLAWVCLLLYVKAQGVGGKAKKMTPLIASRQWLVGEEDVTQMLSAAMSDDAIRVEDGEWVVTSWAQFQETSADRTRQYRERKSVTSVTLCDKSDTTETETVTKTVFKAPTPFDVAAYMKERLAENPTWEAEKFCDFYTSKGWMVGKNKMKDWQAAVRNWLKDKPKTSRKLKDWNE